MDRTKIGENVANGFKVSTFLIAKKFNKPIEFHSKFKIQPSSFGILKETRIIKVKASFEYLFYPEQPKHFFKENKRATDSLMKITY